MLGDCRFISDFVAVAALIVIMVPPADMYIFVIYIYATPPPKTYVLQKNHGLRARKPLPSSLSWEIYIS